MKSEMVSVIIPTYSRANFIQRAIDSVLNQTYQNFEIIVVDDNNPNTDERNLMIQTMERYKDNKKVKYIKHPMNLNGSFARNTGILNSVGKYITFLDDDDYFFPTRLEKLVNKMKKDNCDGIYTSMVIVQNSKIIKYIKASKSGNLQIDMLKQDSFFGTGSNMFFKREVLDKLKGFDISFKRHQDIEFFVRFFEYFKISYVDDLLVVKNNDDRSNNPNIFNALKYRLHFLTTFESIISKYPSDIKHDIYYKNFLDLSKLAMRARDLKNYKLIKKSALKYNIKLKIKDKVKLFIIYFDSIFNLYSIIKSNKIQKLISDIKKEDLDFIYNN